MMKAMQPPAPTPVQTPPPEAASRLRLLLAACLALGATPALAASLDGVVAEQGEPISEAEVLVVDGETSAVLDRRLTDARGGFRFDLDPGRYDIGVFTPNHAPAWQRDLTLEEAGRSLRIEVVDKAFAEDPEDYDDGGDCD